MGPVTYRFLFPLASFVRYWVGGVDLNDANKKLKLILISKRTVNYSFLVFRKSFTNNNKKIKKIIFA